MQANWSLVLNVLLLIGVIVAIGRMMKAKRGQAETKIPKTPSIGQPENGNSDDIVAVRKINSQLINSEPEAQIRVQPNSQPKPQSKYQPQPQPKHQPSLAAKVPQANVEKNSPHETRESISSVMMFLLAKGERQLAGYELLQTLLAAGLRFGEGHLFHRHQYPNGQGPVLCSLAAATATGVFDLQNIGAFSVRGLCLFMQASGNSTIDTERFEIMLDTAKQLSEGLDALLLDQYKKPLTDASVQQYYRLLNLNETLDAEIA